MSMSNVQHDEIEIVFEASELGWGVGQWPRAFLVDGVRACRQDMAYAHDGDLLYAVYMTDADVRVLVFND